MIYTIPVSLDVESSPVHLPLQVEDGNEIDLDLETGIVYRTGDIYPGEATVIPSEETQILQTAGFQMPRNVTIEPIPQNYGLITWNGSVITVS